MGKKNTAANSTQLIVEKSLRIAVWILAAMYSLLSVFRYAIDIAPIKTFVKWFALVLLISSLVYLLINRMKYAPTFYRIKSFFSSMKSYKQIFLIALFLWFALFCLIWQSTSRFNYLKTLDWYLLNTGISALVLYPFAFYARKQKAKLV